jgi:hypothetical protein
MLPRGIRALVEARSRYNQYNRELRAVFPSLYDNDIPRYKGAIRAIAAEPRVWWSCFVFLGVNVAAALKAHVSQKLPRFESESKK